MMKIRPFAFCALTMFTWLCSLQISLRAQGTFGTPLQNREYNDGSGSQVYIFSEAGGLSGPAQSFSFFNDEVFDGRVTPLIFERVSAGNFILRGVGATITPSSTGSQTYPFTLIAGTNIMQPNYTFGFTDRQVSYPGSGNTITTTDSRTGTIDWDYAGPTQWMFTPSLTFEISLGQSFQVGGLLFASETRSYSAQFTVAAPNQAPTNITLNPGSLPENSPSGSSVGTLTATDPDASQTHSFSLVAGGTDNSSFSISGSTLFLNLVPNFEAKSSYSVRVRANDGNGGLYDKDLTVTITNVNEPPTDITLSSSSIAENNAANATVGTLGATGDPDAGATHTFSLVSGAGSADNSSFTISGTSLRLIPSADFETKSSYSLRVQASDGLGGTFAKALTVTITNVNEATTDLTLSPSSIAENNLANATVGTLTAVGDPDAGATHTFSLVSGAGSTDNSSFSILGSALRLTPSANFEFKSSYSLRVQADDGLGGIFAKALTVTITNVNEPPTDLSLSSSTITENNAVNATVGTLNALGDPDVGASYSFALVSGAGGTDNASFNIDGNNLRLSVSTDFETKGSYSLRVRTTDQGGLFFEKSFTITVLNANDLPVAIANAFATPTNVSRTIDVADLIANDRDQDNDVLTVTSVQNATQGASISLTAGVITYTPAAAFTGSATFNYTLSDGVGGVATGIVNMTVNATEPVVLNNSTMTITQPTTISNPVTLSGDGGITTNQPVTLSGPVTVSGTPVIQTNTTVTINGPIEGSGELEKTGTGTLNLNSPSTFTGGFKATQGVVGIGDDQALGSGPVTLGGADLNAIGETRVLANPVTITNDTVVTGAGIGLSGPVSLSGSKSLQTDGNLDIDGSIQSSSGGNVQITKLGTGDLILAGNNTFQGGVDVKQGTLAIAGDSSAGTGPVTLSGGTLEAIGDRQLNNPIEIKADSVVKGDTLQLNGPVEVSGSKTLTTEADVVISGTVSTSTPEVVTKLTKEGEGTLTLSSDAKNNLDIEINDGAFENKGVSYGSIEVVSEAPEVVRKEGQYASQAIVEGFPAVSYYDEANGDLKYMRAASADGASFQAAITVDSAGEVGIYTSLFVINGNPAIAYWTKNGDQLKYARALDIWGTRWGTPVVVYTGKGEFTSMVQVNGNPAIAFKSTSNNDLLYIRALNANGSSWGTAVTVSSLGDVGSFPSMIVVDRCPAIACLNLTNRTLFYRRANNATGTAWGTPETFSRAVNALGALSLNLIQQRPAIAFVGLAPSSPRQNKQTSLLYIRAVDRPGSEWPYQPEVIDDKCHLNAYVSMSVVGGVPAVSYYSDSTSLNYAWSRDNQGTSWPSSRRELVQRVSTPNSFISLKPLLGEYAGLAFYDGKSDDIEYKSFLPEETETFFTSKSRIKSRAGRKSKPSAREKSKKAGKSKNKRGIYKGKNAKGKKSLSRAKGGNAKSTKAGRTKKQSRKGGFKSPKMIGKKSAGLRGSSISKNGCSPGMSEEAEDLIWEDGVTIVWDINDANGLPGLNWDYYKVGEDFEIIATADDPLYLEIESLLPDNSPGNLANFSPYVARSWKLVSAGNIIGFHPSKFVITANRFSNDLRGGSFSIAQSGTDLNLVYTPASTLVPDITLLQAGSVISSGGALNFGSIPPSGQTTLTFTLRNDGVGPLSSIRIGDAVPVTSNALISLDVPEVYELAPGGTLTFDVTLSNSELNTDGLVASFAISSDDPDEGVIEVFVSGNSATIPKPEIAVTKTAGSINLPSGNLTPVDFGVIPTGQTVVMDFTLINQGLANLSNLDFIVDGPSSIDFQIRENNLTDLEGETSTTFKVEFEPSAAGVRTATLYIRSNDADESPFVIHLRGVGDAMPEIVIAANGQELVAGSATPVVYGSQAVNAYRDIVFNISNVGALDLTGLSAQIMGSNLSQFSLQTILPATTLAPADGVSLVVRYSPTTATSHQAVLRVTSNDLDESPFDILLSGVGVVAPEFELSDASSTVLENGALFDLGEVTTGTVVSRTFTIRNLGSALLNGVNLALFGAASGDYTLTSLSSPPPISGPTGARTFSITFSPSALGSRNALLNITSNDPDEGDFTLFLTGTGAQPTTALSDLLLSSSTINENHGPGTIIGTLGAVGGNPNRTLSYSLVAGAGDTHNSFFSLDETNLILNENPDFELRSSYSIRIQVRDSAGGVFAKAFTISVVNLNDEPSGLLLSSAAIFENNLPGATVGSFSVFDQDVGQSHVLSLVPGLGDEDNASFSISGNNLNLNDSAVFASKSIYFIRVRATDNGPDALFQEQSFVISIVQNTPRPVLSVSGNGRAILNNDVSPTSLDGTHFGSIVQSAVAVRTFTLANTGALSLSLSATPRVEITGTHSGDFRVVTMPPSSLAALSGSATLQILFQPLAAGTRNAIVSILSNDPFRPDYRFAIQGVATPAPGGTIGFSSEAYDVTQGASKVVMTLVRTGGTAATSVRLTTQDGSAVVQRLTYQPAVSGTHYQAQNVVVNFALNEMAKTVTIPLISQTGVQPNRRFFATLSDVPAGTSLSSTLSTGIVRILAWARPTVSLTTPAATATTVSSISPYAISGQAVDVGRAGITRVTVALNSAAPVEATLGTVSGITRPWSLSITPQVGLNTLEVIAYDGNGIPSLATTRSFTFTQRYRLAAGLGSTGGVTARSTPASSTLLLTTSGSLRTYGVLPNTVVTVTATPAAGQVFSHWSSLPDGASAIASSFTYTMPAANVASTVTAAFVANPFQPAAGQGNVFYGLVRPEVGNLPALDRVGWITGTLTPTTGAFSGRLLYNGTTTSFAAIFMGNGSSVFNVAGQMRSTLTLANGDVLSLSFASGQIGAQVQRAGSVWSRGSLERIAYTATNPIPDALMNRSNAASTLISGFYSLALPAQAQPIARDRTTYPQGDGFGTISLARAGTFTATGILADGTGWTASGGLVSGQQASFFAQLLTHGMAARGGTLTGTFSGTLRFDATQADSDLTGDDLLWTRAAVTELPGTSAAAQATQLYTAGWPNGIIVDGVGALYNSSRTLQSILGLSTSAANVGNSELVMSDGKLTSPVLVSALRIVDNLIARIPATNSTFTLTASASLGTMSGSFTPNWTSPSTVKPTFRGILLEKGNAKGGYGFFRSNRLSDVNPEVGRVLLGAP